MQGSAAEFFDMRPRRPRGEKSLQRLETALIAAGDHPYAAVGKIDGAAAKPQLARQPSCRITEKDSLDTTEHFYI